MNEYYKLVRIHTVSTECPCYILAVCTQWPPCCHTAPTWIPHCIYTTSTLYLYSIHTASTVCPHNLLNLMMQLFKYNFVQPIQAPANQYPMLTDKHRFVDYNDPTNRMNTIGKCKSNFYTYCSSIFYKYCILCIYFVSFKFQGWFQYTVRL